MVEPRDLRIIDVEFNVLLHTPYTLIGCQNYKGHKDLIFHAYLALQLGTKNIFYDNTSMFV